MKIVLASRSPRRLDLIRLLGYPYEAIPADVDEESVKDPDVASHALRISHLKAEAVQARLTPSCKAEGCVVVAADTIVALDDHILGKPNDEGDARRMLLALRDRTHFVFTGITLVDVGSGRDVGAVHRAEVHMRSYGEEEIEAYIASGDPLDKAGAYAIQHPEFQPVDQLEGCYLGVMGLSICHLVQTLLQLELPVLADAAAVYEAHNHYPCRLFREIWATT